MVAVHAGALQKQLVALQAALQQAQAQAQAVTKYQAYVHWKQQAESNGATLKGVTLLAAGVGIARLLGGGGGGDDPEEDDLDDDGYEDDDDE